MPLHANHSTSRIQIFRAGSDEPIVTQHAEANKRPFIHPLLAPDGLGELTENEPAHHGWQHGLYVGLNDVNGFGFWTEGLTGNALDGTFHPHPLEAPSISSESATWQVVTDWRSPTGARVLTETQCWQFDDNASTTALTLKWTLLASADIQFGASRYGGLFLRMPWRSETGGDVLTSEGSSTHETAEGQRARWLALAMPLPSRESGKAGMAILDHSSNAEHPIPWRVDGELGVSPSRSIAGQWSLKEGEQTVNRYRLITFVGSINPDDIRAAWNRFAQE